MKHLDLVKLTPLMELTSGRPEIMVGLLDGPVAKNHPDLIGERIRGMAGDRPGTCSDTNSDACMHGTFVAGMLCAKRSSVSPAICPHCTLLVRPLFREVPARSKQTPAATPAELAGAILDSVRAGARVLNLSVAVLHPIANEQRDLADALNYAARHSVIVVAAAGNLGTVGGSILTHHPWVLPVVACDLTGRPLKQSNLGHAIGRRGLSAPGADVTSLGVDGKPLTWEGTSFAAPFVTGTIALLWSEFPTATAAEVKLAVTHASLQRRTSVVPPLLDAWAAYQALQTAHRRR